MYTAGSGFSCSFGTRFFRKSLHSYVAVSPTLPPYKVVSFIETVMVQQTQPILVHVGLKGFINIEFVILFHFAMHNDACMATYLLSILILKFFGNYFHFKQLTKY